MQGKRIWENPPKDSLPPENILSCLRVPWDTSCSFQPGEDCLGFLFVFISQLMGRGHSRQMLAAGLKWGGDFGEPYL